MIETHYELVQLGFQLIVTIVSVVAVGIRLMNSFEGKMTHFQNAMAKQMDEIRDDFRSTVSRLFTNQERIQEKMNGMNSKLTKLNVEHDILKRQHFFCHHDDRKFRVADPESDEE